MSLDEQAQRVLRRYPDLAAERVEALGNHGGFSGASLWRVHSSAGPLCLRAWPAAFDSPERLAFIHALMQTARGAGLEFVPAVFRLPGGRSVVEQAGRRWDLCRWMPGFADFCADPSLVRIQAAFVALARLHRAWSGGTEQPQPCPAVQRRLDLAREWLSLRNSGWRPSLPQTAHDPISPLAERAWRFVSARLEEVLDLLHPLADISVPVQPCLCDVWHDHVLFEGDHVSGIVDYGSMKIDHVAVDLARLLGSLAGDDLSLRQAGLEAYRRVGTLSLEEERLISVLDRTGTVLAAANWLRWLYLEGRAYDDRQRVAERLAGLVRRMERWRA